MLQFVCGIAVGAVFSPFWIGLYNSVKPIVVGWFSGLKK